MSKNLEITKAVEVLKASQNNTFNDLLNLINQLTDGFVEEEGLSSNNIPGGADNYDVYYAELGLLLKRLNSNLRISLENFSKIASSYNNYDSSVEEVVFDQKEKTESVWEIINQLRLYIEDEEELDFEDDSYEDDDDREEYNLEELFCKIKNKLIVFEENLIILIKLYNQDSGNPKLGVPDSLFSSQDEMNQNTIILMLIKRGVEIE